MSVTSLTPYLTVDDGKAAIEFYKRAFSATERGVMTSPDGKVAHAALQIGNGAIMLSDRFPQSACETPKDLGGTTIALFLYVENVDAVIRDAAAAGATVTMLPEDQFWGDRLGQVTDPFGHVWQIATRVEEVAPEEVDARARELLAAAPAAA